MPSSAVPALLVWLALSPPFSAPPASSARIFGPRSRARACLQGAAQAQQPTADACCGLLPARAAATLWVRVA